MLPAQTIKIGALLNICALKELSCLTVPNAYCKQSPLSWTELTSVTMKLLELCPTFNKKFRKYFKMIFEDLIMIIATMNFMFLLRRLNNNLYML